MTQDNRLWFGATALITIVLVAAGWFLGLQPALAAAAEADSQRVSVESQIASQQATISALEAEQRKLPALKKEYALLQKSVPDEADTSGFITNLDALAVAAGVQILGFTVADPVAYTVPASAGAGAVTTDETATTDESAAPTVAAGPSPAPVITSPLITSDNFVIIEMGIDVGGTYEAVLSFVNGLQTGERLFLVTGLNSTAQDGAVRAHVSGVIYVVDVAR